MEANPLTVAIQMGTDALCAHDKHLIEASPVEVPTATEWIEDEVIFAGTVTSPDRDRAAGFLVLVAEESLPQAELGKGLVISGGTVSPMHGARLFFRLTIATENLRCESAIAAAAPAGPAPSTMAS